MNRVKLLNLLVPLWFAAYACISWAGTFTQDVKTYDFESLAWAGAAGLLGGAFRTILTLASDKRVVLDILRESWKDALVSIIAGLAVYVVVQGVSAGIAAYWNGAVVPRDLRMLFVVAAGWSRISAFGKLDRLIAAAQAGAEKKISGGAAGSSAAMPLDDGKKDNAWAKPENG